MTRQKPRSGAAISFGRSGSVRCRRRRDACRRRWSARREADSENNDEKRKARYKETDHVKAFYRVNRYPAERRLTVLIKRTHHRSPRYGSAAESCRPASDHRKSRRFLARRVSAHAVPTCQVRVTINNIFFVDKIDSFLVDTFGIPASGQSQKPRAAIPQL